MNRNEKQAFVESFKGALESSSMVMVVRQTSLSVSNVTELRTKMRAVNANFKVAKNSLARIAVKGLKCEILTEYLVGPTAIAYSEDPVSGAKVISSFSKDNSNLEVICGSLDGVFLDAEAIHKLAMLPSLDELRGKIVGLISAPATKIAGVVQAPAGNLARVFSAYGSK